MTVAPVEVNAITTFNQESDEDVDYEYMNVLFGHMHQNGTMFFKFEEPILLF